MNDESKSMTKKTGQVRRIAARYAYVFGLLFCVALADTFFRHGSVWFTSNVGALDILKMAGVVGVGSFVIVGLTLLADRQRRARQD
jgi:hypothetical protein